MKFKLTKETKTVFGIEFHRIEALKSFGDIKKGEKVGMLQN